MNDAFEVAEEKFSYQKENWSIKETVHRYIRKLGDLYLQEHTSGYWDERPIQIGNSVSIIKTYHPDLRQAVINGVDFLYALIAPYISKDNNGTFAQKLAELRKEEEDEFNRAKENKLSKDQWVQSKLDIKKKVLNEIILFLDRIDYFESAEQYTEGGGSTK